MIRQLTHAGLALALALVLTAGPTLAADKKAPKPPPKKDKNSPKNAKKPAKPGGDVVFEPDIEFANPDSQHLKLDLARPKSGKGPFPAILVIHGGGFRAGSRKGHDNTVKDLAKNGYVAITVDYRLAPKYKFPAAVHDVKAAVRWLRANAAKYHIDTDRIGITGDSAGGCLALLLGVTGDVHKFAGREGGTSHSSRVACVVSYYGPSDLTRSYGKSKDAKEVLPLYLGGDLKKARHRHIEASPLYWVTPDAAPTLCVQGTKDDYVAPEQATWMVDRLKAAGVEADLLSIDGAGHGFRGDDADTANQARLDFFNKHLKKKK